MAQPAEGEQERGPHPPAGGGACPGEGQPGGAGAAHRGPQRPAAEERGLRRKKEALEAELSAHKRLAQRDLDRRFTQAKGELDRAQADLDALRKEQARFGPIPHKEELKRAQGELAYLKALEPEIKQGEEALAQAEAELEEARSAARDDRFPGQTVEEPRSPSKKRRGSMPRPGKMPGPGRSWPSWSR